ncbi:5149_t:CDS:2 [Funneliformis caledonium]|uniref:5149_t:CDS:1 n=1 Tax=Funneliformis caledonium TaxID=1117310 RepID=A0A9N9DVZ5_9GLOM|nr:5149_t:CDS:2 [Funneliformis caledonium]
MDRTVYFPKTVVDIDGFTVNVDEAAKRHVLIFITLKATWCPVCPQLLYILNLHGLHDDPPSSFRDAFDRTIITVPQEEIATRCFFHHNLSGPCWGSFANTKELQFFKLSISFHRR